MAQPGDEDLSCEELKQQIDANSVAAQDFLRKDKQVEDQNTAKTVGSAIPFIGILLAGSNDFSNSEQVQARALVDRDERLKNLSKHNECKE